VSARHAIHAFARVVAERRKWPFVELGYWIKESCKMSHKANFQPVEGLVRGQ
jgi:leucyl-tRNA---protein transferase